MSHVAAIINNVDFGATPYMKARQDWFTNLDHTLDLDQVSLGDDSSRCIQGTSDIFLPIDNHACKIIEVLYV